MKRFILGTLILVILVTFISFNIKPSIKAQSGPETSRNYLIDKGYEIVDYVDRTSISFSEDQLSLSDVHLLTLINEDFKNLINKEIIIDTYMVTNHPLDNNFKRFIRTIEMGLKVKYPNMTRVQVAMIDHKVVGGFSNIYYTGPRLLGSTSYNLEGNSIETRTKATLPI